MDCLREIKMNTKLAREEDKMPCIHCGGMICGTEWECDKWLHKEDSVSK